MSRYAAALAAYFDRSAAVTGTAMRGEAGSEAQGAWIQVGADVADGRLTRVGFRVFACPHIIAACHRAAELLEGAPVTALRDVSLDDLRQQFEIPVEKAGKLLILKDALANCLPQAATGHQD